LSEGVFGVEISVSASKLGLGLGLGLGKLGLIFRSESVVGLFFHAK